MKRQRVFLDEPSSRSTKKPMLARTVSSLSLVPSQPKLNSTQQQQVKRILRANIETKHFLSAVSAAGISTSPTTTSISNIVQGDGDAERIGNVVSPTRLKLNYSISASDATNAIRVCVFKWKDSNAFINPNGNDFFKIGPSGVVDYLSHYNEEQRDQFQVIYDKTFQLVLNTNTTKKIVHVDLPLSGKIRYYSNAVITGTGNYFLYYVSDSLAISHPTIEWASEIVFTDQ